MESIEHIEPSKSKSGLSKLLKAEVLSEAWGIPLPSIYEKARTGLIPSVRIGRLIRFKADVLEQFIEQGGKHIEGDK